MQTIRVLACEAFTFKAWQKQQEREGGPFKLGKLHSSLAQRLVTTEFFIPAVTVGVHTLSRSENVFEYYERHAKEKGLALGQIMQSVAQVDGENIYGAAFHLVDGVPHYVYFRKTNNGYFNLDLRKVCPSDTIGPETLVLLAE